MLGNAMGNSTGAAKVAGGDVVAGQTVAGGAGDAMKMPGGAQQLDFSQQGTGPYTAMGGQGSAGALGQQPNPYMKNPYSKFGPVG
jgi:hypothetical protein